MGQPYRFGSLLAAEEVDDWEESDLTATNPVRDGWPRTENIYSPIAFAETDLGD